MNRGGLFTRDALGRLVPVHAIPVNPGLPVSRGNQGGMGRRLDEAGIMSTLPDADIAGAIGPGVKPGGEQSLGARRAKLEAEEAVSPPAPTYRPLGGAQQNNRGNIKIVTLPVSTGENTVRVASVVETSKSSGDDAEVLSVQLALDLPDAFTSATGVASNCPLEIVCLLEWGVGGAFFQAECDWNQGTSFTICASFLRVSARVTYGNVLFGLNTDTDIVLKASLGYGNAASLQQSSAARRTIPMRDSASVSPFNIGPGITSDRIAIPPYAMGFTLIDGTPSPPNYKIQMYADAGGGFIQAIYNWTDRTNTSQQVEGQFPIPGGCRFIEITNLSGVNSVVPKLIFNMGF